MTKEQFNELWKNGKSVKVTMSCDMPTCNFLSFPEEVTNELVGTFCGVHFGFEDRNEFYADWETCMFDLEIVGDLNRRKMSHGEHVYLIKMIGDEDWPVLEVEHGAEYRTKTFNCIIKKINI